MQNACIGFCAYLILNLMSCPERASNRAADVLSQLLTEGQDTTDSNGALRVLTSVLARKANHVYCNMAMYYRIFESLDTTGTELPLCLQL